MYIFIKIIVLDGYTTWHYLSFDFGNVMEIFMENEKLDENVKIKVY